MKKLILLSIILIVGCDNSTEATPTHGCLDSQACNYDSDATIENNSCAYTTDALGVCGGDCVNDNNNNGLCDNNEIPNIVGNWTLIETSYWDSPEYSPDCYNAEKFDISPQYNKSFSFSSEYKDAFTLTWQNTLTTTEIEEGYSFTLTAQGNSQLYLGEGTYLQEGGELCIDIFAGVQSGNPLTTWNGCFSYEFQSDTLIMIFDDASWIEDYSDPNCTANCGYASGQVSLPHWLLDVDTANTYVPKCGHFYFIKDN